MSEAYYQCTDFNAMVISDISFCNTTKSDRRDRFGILTNLNLTRHHRIFDLNIFKMADFFGFPFSFNEKHCGFLSYTCQ